MYFEHLFHDMENLKARYNSFIVTAYDDSMTVEMQMRSYVKFIKDNMKLTNEMVDYLNEFIKTFDDTLYETLDDVLNEWLENEKLKGIFETIWGDEFYKWFNDMKQLVGHDIAYQLVKRVTFLELNARYKTEKITSYDLSTASDKDKIQLENLGEEVLKALSGSGNTIPPILTRHSVLRNHLANGSVGVEKIAPKSDLAEEGEIFKNKLIIGATSDNKVQLVDSETFSVLKIPLKKQGVINIKYIGEKVLSSGQFIFVGDTNGNRTYMRACRDKLDVDRQGWSIVKIFGDDYIRINLKNAPETDMFIWLTYKTDEIDKIGVVGEATHKLSDFKFLEKPLEDDFIDGSTVIRKMDRDIDVYSQTTKIMNKALLGYNVGNNEVLMVDSDNHFVTKITLPINRVGVLKIAFKIIPGYHQFYIGDRNGKYITSINDKNLPNLKRTGWEVDIDNQLVKIDLEKISSQEGIIYYTCDKKDPHFYHVYMNGYTSVIDLLSKNNTKQFHQLLKNDVELFNGLKTYENVVLNGYDIETNKVSMIPSQYNNVYQFNYPETREGKVRIYYDLATTGHQVYIGDKNGLYITSINKNNFENLSRQGWFVNKDEHYFEIDFNKVIANEHLIYFTLPINSVKKAYVKLSGSTYFKNLMGFDNNTLLTSKLDFVLPNVIHVLENSFKNIYFDNIIYGDKDRSFYKNVSCFSNGSNRSDHVNVDTKKNNSLDFTVIDNGVTLINSLNVNIVKPPIESKKLLVLGESTLDSGKSPHALSELKKLGEKYNRPFTFIGTRGDTVKHEARSGWGVGAYRYLEKRVVENAPTTENSFYNPEKKMFDYQYFKEKNGFDDPDIVIIRFNINNPNRFVEHLTNETFIEHYQFIIEDIKKHVENVRFIIDTSSTISRHDNVFPNSEREVIAKRNKDLLLTFSGKEHENIFVSNSHLFISPIVDYPTKETLVDEYQDIKEITVLDNTHPNEYGQKKLAHALFDSICYVTNKNI